MLERWSRPLRGLSDGTARVVDGFYRLLGRPGRWLQDFLNGSWLGHSLHPVIVDVVIGGSTAAVLLLILDWLRLVRDIQAPLAWILALTWLGGLAAIFSGLTDFKDTAVGDERNLVGMHGLLNIIGTLGFFAAFLALIGGAETLAGLLLLAAYLVIGVGGFIGGHIVFKYGYMVNHNAFARGKRVKEFTALLPAADLPEATPTKFSLGSTTLVLVRRGDVVHALKSTCSHAGGPLDEGKLEGDSIVCPWHASAFRLADGAVRHGPATSRQVSYRARIQDGQVEVQGPIEAGG